MLGVLRVLRILRVLRGVLLRVRLLGAMVRVRWYAANRRGCIHAVSPHPADRLAQAHRR